MLNEPMSNAELDTMYINLCNGVEALHQQSQAQNGLARVLFHSFTSFVAERSMEDIDVSINWMEQYEGYDDRTCSYGDDLKG